MWAWGLDLGLGPGEGDWVLLVVFREAAFEDRDPAQHHGQCAPDQRDEEDPLQDPHDVDGKVQGSYPGVVYKGAIIARNRSGCR